MEQTARVTAVHDDGTASVTVIRKSACSGDCHQCSGCGAQQQVVRCEAANPVEAKIGELVTVRTESGPVLLAATVMYVGPMVLFFLGYLAGALLWQQGGICGCAGFFAGIALAVLYDRKVVKKKETVYTIIGRANVLDAHAEGDNDLD